METTDLSEIWQQVADQPARQYALRIMATKNGKVVHVADPIDIGIYDVACGFVAVRDGAPADDPRMRMNVLPRDTEPTCQRCIDRGLGEFPTALPTLEEGAIAMFRSGRCPKKTYPDRDGFCGAPSAPGVPYGACTVHAAGARTEFGLRMDLPA